MLNKIILLISLLGAGPLFAEPGEEGDLGENGGNTTQETEAAQKAEEEKIKKAKEAIEDARRAQETEAAQKVAEVAKSFADGSYKDPNNSHSTDHTSTDHTNSTYSIDQAEQEAAVTKATLDATEKSSDTITNEQVKQKVTLAEDALKDGVSKKSIIEMVSDWGTRAKNSVKDWLRSRTIKAEGVKIGKEMLRENDWTNEGAEKLVKEVRENSKFSSEEQELILKRAIRTIEFKSERVANFVRDAMKEKVNVNKPDGKTTTTTSSDDPDYITVNGVGPDGDVKGDKNDELYLDIGSNSSSTEVVKNSFKKIINSGQEQSRTLEEVMSDIMTDTNISKVDKETIREKLADRMEVENKELIKEGKEEQFSKDEITDVRTQEYDDQQYVDIAPNSPVADAIDKYDTQIFKSSDADIEATLEDVTQKIESSNLEPEEKVEVFKKLAEEMESLYDNLDDNFINDGGKERGGALSNDTYQTVDGITADAELKNFKNLTPRQKLDFIRKLEEAESFLKTTIDNESPYGDVQTFRPRSEKDITGNTATTHIKVGTDDIYQEPKSSSRRTKKTRGRSSSRRT